MTKTEKPKSPHTLLEEEYVGRFAPSPSGPLHFGSLIAAVASYLDARSHNGKWLVRMEDLDPPREPKGTAALILKQLEAFALVWDGEVLYQSERLEAYSQALRELNENGLCFACNCTRARLNSLGNIYDGKCRSNAIDKARNSIDVENQFAIRIKTSKKQMDFFDRIQGQPRSEYLKVKGDFVIKRKDKLFAYQLAVVVDDAYQKISHVVRGYDLLDSTPRQIYLQSALGLRTPEYAHFPVAVDSRGDKLSKQQFAKPIDSSNPAPELKAALSFLGVNINEEAIINSNSAKTILEWGVQQWDIQRVPKLATITDQSSS